MIEGRGHPADQPDALQVRGNVSERLRGQWVYEADEKVGR